MAETSASIRPLLAYRDGGLEMDGVALAGLVERWGTPVFVASERRLVANYRALAEGLRGAGGEVRLRYCAKANHEAGLLAVLARQGSELLASHRAEVELALASGFAPERIAYQRPAPPQAEVEAVLALGVTHLHVFRPEDLPTFGRLAERLGRSVRLSLRLRSGSGRGPSPLAALNARLGLAADEAVEVAAACRGRAALRIAALNLYLGTQQPGLRRFDRELRAACALAARLARAGLAEIEEINLGGGIPSPSQRRLGPRTLWARWRDRTTGARGADAESADEGPRRLADFARGLGERYRAAVTAAGLARPPALAAEPGRSIVGNAVVLISRVVAAERGWLFLDASRNVLGESPLLFGRAILPLRDLPRDRDRFVHLSGSTLNTMDVVDLRRRLPELAAGDALVFRDAGAYSISRANRYGGLAPAVLAIDELGAVREIRRPEIPADLMGPMAPALGGDAPR